MSGHPQKPVAMIVGGDSLLREAVGSLLVPISRETFSYETAGDGLIRRVEQDRPDLMVFLDGARQIRVGPAIVRKLKAVRPGIRLIVLASDIDPAQLTAMVAAGVDGYLMRDTTADALRHALHLVMLGERAYSAPVVEQLLRTRPMPHLDERTGTGPELTSRQRDILRCLAEGQSNKDIARRFGTSEATVKVQVRAILRRIGVENRTQAAIWAVDTGINHAQTGPTPLGRVN